MPVHRMADTEYTELLHLILRETNGEYVADRLASYPASRIRWIREWSMLLGYVELTGFTFDCHSPTGFALPAPRLSESGRARLAELDQMPSFSAVSHKPGDHLMWLPGGENR